MAEDLEGDTLELTPGMQVDEPEDNAGADEHSDEPEELEVPTFLDGTEEDEQDTPRMRDLRAKLRDALVENKKLKEPVAEPEIVVGDKPTLESCEWDEQRFETELDAYKERKRQAEERKNAGQEEARKRQDAWNTKLQNWNAKRAALPFKDLSDAETAVSTTLPPTMQQLIIRVANDPAKLVYALGKSEAKLNAVAEAAKNMDEYEQAAFIARLEGEMKMTKRRTPPAAQDTVRGSAPLSRPNPDKELEKLEKEAERTGDRTKIIAFKRAEREKKEKAA